MKITTEVQPPSATDGRVRRSERSREAIVSALYDLIGAGTLQPTAQQVADHAGVGIRSVFRHFSEMESLYAAMVGRIQQQALDIMSSGDRSGTLAHRATSMVQQRARLFERIAPYKRSADTLRWRSSFLRERHARMQRALRADMLNWLPELRRSPSEMVEAVDLATSFDAWNRLRGDRQVSQKLAVATIERTVRALVRELARQNLPARSPRGHLRPAGGARGVRGRPARGRSSRTGDRARPAPGTP